MQKGVTRGTNFCPPLPLTESRTAEFAACARPCARRKTDYGIGLLHGQSHVACSMTLLYSRDSLGRRITTRDKRQGSLRALHRIARCHVIGIPWQHEQLGVRNGLLPRPRVVYTRQTTALRGDH